MNYRNMKKYLMPKLDKHDFCRGRLKLARSDAKEAGVVLPVISSSKMHEEHYAVFGGNDDYEEYNSCCAYDARASFVYEFIDKLVEKDA